MKTTPIDEIEDLADGVPVLAVEGTVKYAADLTRNKEGAAHPWTKQFFVLSSGTAEIACSMWDAEGSELSKGEKVHIENTQNKKGQWNGMTKGSYIKTSDKGEKLRMHTLEIRCNQVKITEANGKHVAPVGLEAQPKPHGDPHPNLDFPPDPDWPEAPENALQSPPTHPLNDAGVTEARKHLMQVCNLYNICIKAAVTSICPNIPDEQRTNEQFQSTLASLWIEASGRRSTNGVDWWSYIDKMPEKPIQ